MNSRFLSTLGLSMRAGKLCFGFDTVKAAALNGEVFLLMTASDLSPKTVKEVAYLAQKQGLPHYALPMTMADVGRAIGKKTGVLGIEEEGFAKSLRALLSEETPAKPGE